MPPEYDKQRQRILEEIHRFLGEKVRDTSTIGVSMAAAIEAQATLIKLVNPVITTPEHRIVILGTVFVASLLECKKVVQCRHNTTGENNLYPKIVEDMLRTGGSPELSKIGRDDIRGAMVEMNNLRLVWTGKHEDGLVFLTGVNPIVPVSEYTIDGRHTSGVPLKGLTTPLIIEVNSAYMEYTSTAGVRITDGRLEQRGSGDFIGPKLVVSGVQNNISAIKKQNRERLGDALTIISGAMLAFGVGFLFIRRGRLIEAALPLVILGGILFYIRHFTDWGKEYFVPSEMEISGEAPLELSFYGELA